MEYYRREMDKSILEQLKKKIQEYLESKGIKDTAKFIRENMDKVVGLYVENSREQGGPRMQSRGNGEIMLDKGFAVLDKNGNPIGIDKSIKKLILSQLTHELLHSGARFDNQTGILDFRTDQNRGLNEGMTQMFTEKIWKYTVSPNADSKYKDYKKIAKILDATFGENVSLDAYFKHSNALEEACNSLSQNVRFYNDVNRYLTSTYYMNSTRDVKKQDKDKYYGSLMKPIRDKMTDLIYEKVCAEIVIPKLKSLSKEEQATYLHSILDSVKDDTIVLRKLSDTIIKYSNMSDKELEEQIKGIDKDLKHTEQKKQFIIDIYNARDLSSFVRILDDGKTLIALTEPEFIIEDENLKEKIFSQLYFLEKGVPKDKFDSKVTNFLNGIEQNNDFRFGKNTNTALDRKKVFSAMKVTAREKGYVVLNPLDECESGESISIEALRIENGKISFQDLKSIYQKYEMDYKDKEWTQLYIKDRESGKEITDPQLVTMAKFASVWVSAAGTKWMADEELHGITYAFNEPSESLYNKFGELVEKCMTENGMINTQAIYEELAKNQYKHSEEIIRTIMSNPANMGIVYQFYKMQNTDAKMETKLSKTSGEFIFGYRAEDFIGAQVEEILESIPDLDVPDSRGQVQEEIIGISQEQSNTDMVTLPNGVKIPRKQYEEEYGTKQGQEDMVTLPNGVKIPKKQYEEEMGTKNGNKKILGSSMLADVLKAKVTTGESKKMTEDIAKTQKINKLRFRQQSGGTLTPEEIALLAETNREFTETQIRYQNQRRQNNGLEM